MATAGNVQGQMADATVDVLKHDAVTSVKWVDDFDFLRYPSRTIVNEDGSLFFEYPYDLHDILRITSSLGIPWHDISEKGHDFSFSTQYGGFEWDLEHKRIALLDKKRKKYMHKIQAVLANPENRVNLRMVQSLHGTLQHASFVYRDGRAFLPALTHFIASFPNAFALFHLPTRVRNDLIWWQDTLSHEDFSRSLFPRTVIDLHIYVDASTGWGIGLVVGDRWAAWRLVGEWRSADRDIGWAEFIAVELAALWISTQPVRDANVLVHGDNQGVIDSLTKGRCRNLSRNEVIRRITTSLIPANLTLSTMYIPSAHNPADSCSRGELGPVERRLQVNFELPIELQPFLLHV
ncbi:hypothetical protein EWM64_g6869 [Hericium alpestre]|uniref:Uncharacterized protein n=1 Tax=Hericium alpestre TaxID=135208 RepID=A0A4Y9ZSY3_9AGAM|nr:hypothetical protein EWM64_g6869 [Hericium alpestre]